MKITQDLSLLTDAKTAVERAQKTLTAHKAAIAGKRFVTLRDPARPNTLIEVEVDKYKKRLKRYAGMEAVGEGVW